MIETRPQGAALAGFHDLEPELEDFEILQTAGGYLNVEDFIQFIDNAESGTVQTGWFEGKGPLFILLAVILGGIALNLTPCVLPLMPINLAIIGAGAQAGSRMRGFALGPRPDIAGVDQPVEGRARVRAAHDR